MYLDKNNLPSVKSPPRLKPDFLQLESTTMRPLLQSLLYYTFYYRIPLSLNSDLIFPVS